MKKGEGDQKGSPSFLTEGRLSRYAPGLYTIITLQNTFLPHVQHQEQKQPPTHFSLLMCHIRKTTTILASPAGFLPSLNTRALSCKDWTKKYSRCAKGRFAHRLQID